MTAASLALSFTVLIPARYASTRLPGKPLLDLAGRPLVIRVAERARASGAQRTVIATDDERIRAAAEAHGVEAILTRADHSTGTDRLAEAAQALRLEDDTIVVNVQGDEPLIDPATVDAVVSALLEDRAIQLATPCAAITNPADIMDPNVVKVVRDFDGNALYFSRAPVPWVRDTSETVAARHWKHLGLYGFRREALLEFPTLPPGELEHLEQLEQLRWLENGFRLRVVETDYDAVSVDVPADIARVEKLLATSQEK